MAQIWDAMARLTNGTTASGLTAKSDGMSSCLERDHLILYGGSAASKIWVLDLSRMSWHEVLCSGAHPPARVYHTAVAHGGYMLVYGGELLNPEEGEEEGCPYYELDLETHVWMKVETFSDHPGRRSHHTATMHDGRMIVFGGRNAARPRGGSMLQEKDLRADKLAGFYDVYVLEVLSRQWTRVERYDEMAPMLWGHSACMFRHYLLLWGGFELSIQDEGAEPLAADVAGEGPPQAALTDRVHLWDTREFVWKRATPRQGEPSPVPRALHCSFVHMAEMIIFGGMTVDATARPLNVNDAWLWDIATGDWVRLEFCLPYWPSKRLISAVHQGRLVVCQDLVSAYILDLTNKPLGWYKQVCDPSGLFRPPQAPLPQPAAVAPLDEEQPPTPPPDTPPPEPASPPAGQLGPFALAAPQQPPPPAPVTPLAPLPDPHAALRRRQRIEEEERLAELREAQLAQRAQQQETIRLLQRQLSALNEQVTELAALQGKLALQSELPGSRAESPRRLADGQADASSLQVQMLTDTLARLSAQQQELHEESRRRQDERIAALQRQHEDQLELLRQQQRLQQASQEKIAATKEDIEKRSAQEQQLELLRDQHKALLDLQGAAERQQRPPPVPPAAVPHAVGPMAQALARLQSIGTRAERPPRGTVAAPPRGSPPPQPSRHWAPPPALGHRGGGGVPQTVAEQRVLAGQHNHQQALRKMRHIEGLQQQLLSIDAELRTVERNGSPALRPSPSPVAPPGQAVDAALGRAHSPRRRPPVTALAQPPRGHSASGARHSLASSSPAEYWDRLRELLGDDQPVPGQVPIGTFLSPGGGSPLRPALPRGAQPAEVHHRP